MIAAATRTAVLRSITEAIFELAEDLHDRSVEAEGLTTTKTAEAISGLGGIIALLAQTATAISKVTVGANSISIEFKADAIDPNAAPRLTRAESSGDLIATHEIELVRRSSVHILSIDGKAAAQPHRLDRTLVRSVVLAKRWMAMLDSGEVASIDALARQEHLCPRNTARVLPLAYLAPDLVEMILAGCQPISLTLSKLLEAQLPFGWSEQRALFAEFV